MQVSEISEFTHDKTGETSEMAAFTNDDISSTVVIGYIAAC